MYFNPISLKTKNFSLSLLELKFSHFFSEKMLLNFCLVWVLGTKNCPELIWTSDGSIDRSQKALGLFSYNYKTWGFG